MKRREVTAGVMAAGAAIAAGLYRFTDLFVKHYPPTPYDDVLAALVDRGQAVRLGAAVHSGLEPKALAARLRASLKPDGLAAAAQSDVAAGRVMEVDGWLLPQSVALLAALAARLRISLKPDGLAAAAQSDVAAGRVMEVDGWLLPQSVALLAALAARV